MSNLNRYYRGALTILFLITCLALLSYLKPPAWIYAARIGRTNHPDRVINVSRTELEQFPTLVEAKQIVDNTLFGVHPTVSAKGRNSEGMKIVRYFGVQMSQDNIYYLLLNVDGQLYQVSILFAHEPLPIA